MYSGRGIFSTIWQPQRYLIILSRVLSFRMITRGLWKVTPLDLYYTNVFLRSYSIKLSEPWRVYLVQNTNIMLDFYRNIVNEWCEGLIVSHDHYRHSTAPYILVLVFYKHVISVFTSMFIRCEYLSISTMCGLCAPVPHP